MVQADCKEWTPKCGSKTKAFFLLAVASLTAALLVAFGVHAFGQDGTTPQPFDWRGLVAAMVPALSAGVAPIALKYLTMGINKYGGFVPRYIQVPVAGILGAIASAWTGDASTVANAIAASGVAQTYAGIPVEKLQTGPPPQPATDEAK